MTNPETINQIYQRRKSREQHPSGTFDKGGRWYPDSSEHASCCDSIRTPSLNWPYSLMLHCRTKAHIKHMLEEHPTS